MSGLPRFDFYPRDWLVETRDLSLEARAVFIDLLAAMYDRGGPIDADPKYLCRLCGLKSIRTLRRIVKELMDKRKVLFLTTDRGKKLANARAIREIEAAHRRMENGRKGGRPPNRPDDPSSGELSWNFCGSLDEVWPELERQNAPDQEDNRNTPPPPSPLPSDSFASASESGANGATASGAQIVDLAKYLFDTGVRYLGAEGVPERNARSVLGKWRKDHGDAAVIDALSRAQREAVSDPVAWISAALTVERRPRDRYGGDEVAERRAGIARQVAALELERAEAAAPFPWAAER